MINPEDDGVKHINVYSKGETQLGRLLSNFAHTVFTHPEDGKFASVEAYWYWLSCKDDLLRSTYGFGAKNMGRALGGKDWVDTDEFKRKIKLAIKTKINSNTILKEKFLNNILPLMHYYVYSGKVVEPKEGKWVIEYLEELRINPETL